jgi:hypothetical protein
MSETQGGSGGRHARRRRLDRITDRALREHWRVPGARRDLMIEPVYQIVTNPAAKPRDVIAAFNTILSACRSNLQSVSTVIKAREHEELATRMVEIERRLGIGEGSVGRGDPAIGGSAD